MSVVQGFAPGQTRSGTPLAIKLGLKPAQNVAFVALPKPLEWLADVAEFASVRMFDGWTDFSHGEPAYDVVHGFSTSRADLIAGMARARMAIRDDGMVWISWPKRASKVATDITEDTIREICLPMGLVDVKVCAVNEIWSGLKLMVRRELRHKG